MAANRPNRGNLLAARLKERIKPVGPPQDDYWEEINRRIKEHKIIPILANSVRNDLIFNLETGDETGEESLPRPEAGAEKTIGETLAEIWAESLGYPLNDNSNLARVAMYNRVKSQDTEEAKIKYLAFVKEALLQLAGSDPQAADVVAELQSQVRELGFADLAQELGYPRFTKPEQDSLRLLARLPLSIYVTTSYYDFLERAIRLEGRKPVTQVCFWSRDTTNILPEHIPDPNFIPTPETPLVYHLFGLERYPRSLVLSEDDYLDFLVEVTGDNDARNPFIPLRLREALAESSLILLGYRLQDWDFRILFRGIINSRFSNLRPFGLIIQIKPEDTGIVNVQEVRRYLTEYFEPAQFKVEWNSADEFIRRMWEEWNQWRQCQE